VPLARFHEAVRRWFEATFAAPTEPQTRGWPAIQTGGHTLIAAPTGSGKTLSAFLCAIDALIREGTKGQLGPGVRVLYVSPLKALTTDVEKNLAAPLRGIEAALAELGHPEVHIETAVRTGDTSAADRERARRRPPHIYVTTPESLYLLLTSEGGRRMLASVRTVIVDEIHALIGSKRGSHLALSLERLDALVGRPVQRIGLSATQNPIEEVARFLVGARRPGADGGAPCTIIDGGHRRALDLSICMPRSPLETVMAGEVWEELYDQIAELVRAHRTTLVFVNNRRLAERVAHHLSLRLGTEAVTAHHGSLSRAHRLGAEQRLKAGALRALVATASLELGIDIGEVELVCQIGTPGSVGTLLQRVGRAGHQVGGTPKGRLFPTSRDELVEHAALLRCVHAGILDRLIMPKAPLDILAQQIVASVAMEPMEEEALFTLMRGAYPYAALEREAFDEVVTMLAEGVSTHRGRRGAYVHRDAVNGMLRARRGARLVAVTSGGAIPDSFDYEVRLEPAGLRVGTVNEDFAIESMAGDIFQLGNASYRIQRVEPGVVRVEDAAGQPPSIPFWLGEAPSRTDEVSEAVSWLREEAEAVLDAGDDLCARLAETPGIPDEAARELADYLTAAYRALGALPTQARIIAERFFDETGGQHIVLHSPFGSRVNRAFGLALRKRFCRSFNVELQAAANEDALVLSLGPTHSLPLEDVFGFLRSSTVEGVLVQALLDAPMFGTRFRWNASRALAIPRLRGGKKVPPRFQRMDSDDLLAVCFPDQVACLENIQGDRSIPDHPLVTQTVDDCLNEAMDVTRLRRLLADLERGAVTHACIDSTEPSPLAQGVLNAKPYAFLDDAPLEERRTQAVIGRRFLDPSVAANLAALDPAAIAQVIEESSPDARDPEELHDALLLFRCLRADDPKVAPLLSHFEPLLAARRAFVWHTSKGDFWVATERAPELRLVHAGGRAAPEPPHIEGRGNGRTREEALRNVVRGRLDAAGPVTAHELAAWLGLALDDVRVGLGALEAEGVVLRGRYRPDVTEEEFCERRLLARIHRYTLGKLRREVQPVSTSDYLRFLARFQHLTTEQHLEGPEGLFEVLRRLEGFEAPASSFEADLLPGRMKAYDPSWLDALCLGGRAAWGKRQESPGRKALTRATPVSLFERERIHLLRGAPLGAETRALGPDAEATLAALRGRGACFGAELPALTGLLPTRAEDALGELVAAGLVASDGFSGLRWLLGRHRAHGARRPGASKKPPGLGAAGRWALLPEGTPDGPDAQDATTAWAWTLLRRYGVVFRRVLERESGLPPFRDLLTALRRLEAQGQIRGGRFVEGVTGEQYALPEAVASLRAARRERGADGARDHRELVSVSAADPLNLVGLLTPGPRVAALAKNRVLFSDGVPVAYLEAGVVHRIETGVDLGPELEAALTRRQVPGAVRAYLGNAI
jgi:ATP-dependent Lhr-like helicase